MPPELTATTARWLVSEPGRELVRRITAALDAGRDVLAISTDGTVRRAASDPERLAAAVAAGVARRRARERHLDADEWLFTREALEQASDPTVSSWRARRYLDAVVVDLCSGVGGDAAALLATARELVTVERDEGRAVLARHNLTVAARRLDVGTPARTTGDGRVRVGVGDALAVAGVRPLDDAPTVAAGQPGASGGGPRSDFRTDDRLVHVDPGRRVGDRRTQDPMLTQPPVDALLARHRGAAGMGIVLAPGVDADHPALRGAGRDRDVGASPAGDDGTAGVGAMPDGGIEVEYVQLGGTLIEAVAWTGVLRDGTARASATLLPRPDGPGAGDGEIHRLVRRGARGPRRPIGPVGDVLVEVAPAAIRARLHDDIGERLGLHRLAAHRALLSGDELPRDPWVRARPVLAVIRARPGAVRAWLREHAVGPVEIVTHGVRVDPTPFWRDIGRPPRGPHGIRIELVRRDDDSVAIITDDAAGWHGW